MSRQYLIGSWNNADEYDYSGEQLMGNRHASSHMIGNKANLAAYADKPLVCTKNKSLHIRDQIIPQLRTLEKLDSQEFLLEQEFTNGSMSFQEYNELSTALEKKRMRAFKSYERAISKQAVPLHSLEGDRRFEGIESQQNRGIEGISDRLLKGMLTQSVKSFKNDCILWLTSSVIGAIILLTLSS